ncbi:MAG: hypothetical protein A3E84_02600 [Gammaproteobacteria bacterium RIFCSPHIGHO2_12_FULL_42_13]|nr:MAG: hypothetical protein A3E84_02600 [Gammaproteobacteria bacterium RIFCSPHIGHO2_12_FULL_42_13]
MEDLNIRSIINQLNKLTLGNLTEEQQFLLACTQYEQQALYQSSSLEHRYGIKLDEFEKSDPSEKIQIRLNKPQQIISNIAADLYHQHIFSNLQIDIDKLRQLIKKHPTHEGLKHLVNATYYFGMSMQFYFHDADGGIMLINAHTIYLQNRSAPIQGQAVNNIIIPGIQQVAEEYTGTKRFIFFEKTHVGFIKGLVEDMLKILFIETFQSYITDNDIDPSITNAVYDNPHTELMAEYDALLYKQTQRYHAILSKSAVKNSHAEYEADRIVREEESIEEKGLKIKVEALVRSQSNQELKRTVSSREYSDYSERLYHDLISCLHYGERELRQKESSELIKRFESTLLTPLRLRRLYDEVACTPSSRDS